MVLCGDLRSAGDQVLDRVVEATVTMVHFKGADIVCQCQQLVTKADPEKGFAGSLYLFDRLNGIIHRGGITGTITDEITCWPEFFQIIKTRFSMKDPNIGATFDQALQDIF